MPTTQAEWGRAVRGFDEQLTVRRIAATWSEMRWMSTERFLRHAETVAGWMRRDGLSDVEVIRLPSDGRTAFGGWVLPMAWSPRAARLELLDPADGGSRLLADWSACPHHLAMWSAPTRRGGVTAGLVAAAQVAAGASPRGRIVLLDGNPDVQHVIALQRAGAHGFITDFVRTYKNIRDEHDVADAVAYLNGAQPQWHVPARDRGFGFAISPNAGRRLRALLAQGPVRLHALVEAEMGKGELPLITGRLPGRTGQEILITGHIDEPGANDNASGPMLALGVARTLARLVRQGWKPERGLRFFFSVEARAINALLNLRPGLFANGVWGLNLDMHGCDHRTVRSRLDFCPNAPPLPDPLMPFMLRHLPKMHGRNWRIGPMVDDNNMGDPAVGVPTSMIGQGPDVTYHTSMDTPAHLSPPAIRRMGLWCSALLGRLCSAGPREVVGLAKISQAWSLAKLDELATGGAEPAALRHHVAQERRRLDGFRRWIADEPFPWVGTQPPQLRRDHLSEGEAARQALAALSRDIARRAPPAPPVTTPADRFAKEAARLVPLKTYRGFFAVESLDDAARNRLEGAAGGRFWWSCPAWLDWALWWSNGKQTLADIAELLRHEGRAVPAERLVATFRILAELGFVRFRPRLGASDIRRALRQVGVKPGMLLMVHSSLSAFGYVDDGSAACLGALRGALGKRGTLAMPTHSGNVLGRAPYDPATSPSLVGAVTEAFRRLPGVLRSGHPTHSVAAQGPLAAELTAGHDASMAPLAREGFWGRFVEADGWVLMMAPGKSNTLMHAAELWSGVPLPGYTVPVIEGGRWRSQVVPHGPWHINWFPQLYAALRESGRLRTAYLGEGEIWLMRGRDVVEAGLALFQADPLRVCKERCSCLFCRSVRAATGAAAVSRTAT